MAEHELIHSQVSPAAADGTWGHAPFPFRFLGNWRRTVDGRGIPPFHDRTVKG